MPEDGIEKRLEESAGNAALRLAFETVEATLVAENWFFQTIRGKLAEVAPLDSYPTVTGKNGHDFLLHFTQFLFFLEALECREAERIEDFIDSHNARIDDLLADPDAGASTSPGELRRAKFKPDRKRHAVETVRVLGAPVFAISEYGALLINTMSAKTTENLIEDLRVGGLMTQREDPRINADGRRILMGSTGVLERTYRMSLLMQRRLIGRSISPAEHRRIAEEE